jgi:RES domain-containing protein
LYSKRYPSTSGKGAALSGGRWNPIGVEVIYAATSVSLATLEILVHFSVLPLDYVVTEIRIPDGVHIEHIPESKLPPRWNARRPIPATQELGRLWVLENRSPVLSVPSSIIPSERNFVINPGHSDFSQLRFMRSRSFRFDPRLK